MISQIKLVSAVFTEIERQGVKGLNTRQMNAVIKAVDDLIVELESPHVSASAGAGLAAWRKSDDTGISSRYLAMVLSGQGHAENDHPYDPSDFGRCVRLLDAAPELRANLPRMADARHGRVWNAIAARWEELEAMYREDLPKKASPRLYEIIKQMRVEAEGVRP